MRKENKRKSKMKEKGKIALRKTRNRTKRENIKREDKKIKT